MTLVSETPAAVVLPTSVDTVAPRGTVAVPAAIANTSLCIISPMANERDNCVAFVKAVLKEASVFGDVLFLAILDNASKDGTVEILREFEKTEPRFRVVWAPENRGVVDAYIRGYREALATGMPWILEIDAGFSHKPHDLPNFFGAMASGYDIVFGSRFCRGGKITDSSFVRYLISRGGTILTNILVGTKLADMTSGYQMFQRHALQQIVDRGIKSRGHFFQTEMKVYARKMNVTEVPIHYSAASKSVNSKSIKDAFRRLFELARDRWTGRV